MDRASDKEQQSWDLLKQAVENKGAGGGGAAADEGRFKATGTNRAAEEMRVGAGITMDGAVLFPLFLLPTHHITVIFKFSFFFCPSHVSTLGGVDWVLASLLLYLAVTLTLTLSLT